jgi:aminomethyltransferase
MSKKTPFYDRHVKFNAKITDFAGYLMPVSYSGIRQEHLAVRNAVGVFDVSHMGEFMVSGDKAQNFLQKITINDISQLKDGQAQYSAMCYPDGGIVDDLIVYRLSPLKYMMVVNASNIDKDFQWAKQHCPKDVSLKNISDDMALLAVQGPKCLEVLQPLTDIPLGDIDFYHFVEAELAGKTMIISRTGYTGERGFELYHDPQDAPGLWDTLFSRGESAGIYPAGLGARDTLRLEMKYALYGNDIDETTNPIEAGLGWITKLEKGDFIGREALLAVKEAKPGRRLVAFRMEERGIPRHGYEVYCAGKAVGKVSSGTLSPSLDIGIGTAYVQRDCAKIGTEILVNIRGKGLKARIIKPPFVDRSPF